MSETTASNTLTDLVEFIKQLKTLDFGSAAAECCAKVATLYNRCIVGDCFTWNDTKDVLSYLQQEFYAGQMDSVFAFLTALTEFFIGLKGKSKLFEKTMSVFWPSMGAVISIVGGTLSGAYSGRKAVLSIVDSTYW